MAGFRSINVNGLGEGLNPEQSRLRGMMRSLDGRDRARTPGRARLAGVSDDTASRLHLQTYLEDLQSETMLAVTSPERPEAVPDLRTRSISAVPDLQANSVVYQQSAKTIPVFGGRVIVDVDRSNKRLVAINGELAPVPDVTPVATLSPADAWQKLLAWAGEDLPAPDVAPVLTWFFDDDQQWHLAYHYSNVPLRPRKSEKKLPEGFKFKAGRCVKHRHAGAPYDYFVDAHSGDVVYFFSSAPRLDIPAPMSGLDLFDTERSFYGLAAAGGNYVLTDPLRNIATYDYQFGDLDEEPPPDFPATPIRHNSANLGNMSPAAVSAHYHATVVFDFFNDVLKRKGIDDRGMKLVSVVNVYASSNEEPKPQWSNASWWQSKMWYGQEPDGNGQLISYAKHLDVIGHELTHGVTSTSSGLVYRDLPGALNESFSDIFGVMIANWLPGAPQPIAEWNWEIGAGLGEDGGPLRNFADPAAAGQPDHMDQYEPLPEDYDEGGVHIYSGIHNRAVHALLTAVDAAGNPVFPPSEVALLLYLALTRLTPTSDFSACRRTLENVASVYYANHANKQQKLGAIRDAYDLVGIV